MRQRNASIEDTRTLLLETGRRLLVERGIPVELKSVTLVDVAKAAGRTTGSAYQLWKTQEEFHRALACFTLRDTTYSDTTVLLEVVGEHLTKGSPLPLLLRDVAHAYLDAMSASREFFVFSHFWAVAIDEPEVSASMAESYAVFQALNVQLIEVILENYAREMCPQVSVDDLAVALGALAEGYVLRHRVTPDAVTRTIVRREYPKAYRNGWSSYSCAVESVVYAFTRDITAPLER